MSQALSLCLSHTHLTHVCLVNCRLILPSAVVHFPNCILLLATSNFVTAADVAAVDVLGRRTKYTCWQGDGDQSQGSCQVGLHFYSGAKRTQSGERLARPRSASNQVVLCFISSFQTTRLTLRAYGSRDSGCYLMC